LELRVVYRNEQVIPFWRFHLMSKTPLIGDIQISPKTFPRQADIIKKFESKDFTELPSPERNEIVNKTLLDLIAETPAPCYLLSETINYLTAITKSNCLDGPFNLTAFERWLNQHSDLSYEDNRFIRGKIIGKYVPRDDYNPIFPIGQNKVHPGSHTVTAHTPPDLDSLTGSFLGWLDAFGCRVGKTLTVWNVPKGEPGPIISKKFTEFYSRDLFYRIAKQKTLISHVAMDIVQQDRLIRAKSDADIKELKHDRSKYHIIHVDQEGYYLGDWRSTDVDAVSKVQRGLNMCMHSYEKFMVLSLTELFSKSHFKHEACMQKLEKLFSEKLYDYIHILNFPFSDSQEETLDLYLTKVLGLKQGSKSPISDFFELMDNFANTDFGKYRETLNQLGNKDFYDNDLNADFEIDEIFGIIHKAQTLLIHSTMNLRDYLDRLDIAMTVKKEILGLRPTWAGTKAEIHEIRSKIKDYQHLTVVFPDRKGHLIPVGVIHRDEVEKPVQGTVTFRDFCNYDEIKLHADYLEVISAIDHHKTSVSSKSAMVLSVADVQSSNILTAQKYFEMNDRYGTRGQTEESISKQLKKLKEEDISQQNLRLMEKLLHKQQVQLRKNKKYFIDPDRELQEYLLCLNAIIDDTDLLNKCGWWDMEVIIEILNRIKSLQLGHEVEAYQLDDITKDRRHLKKCIRDLLCSEDFYSFYREIYEHREEVVSALILATDDDEATQIFVDRKIQNHSCSISQFKLFPRNWDDLKTNRENILLNWLDLSRKVREKNSEVDFFLHMMSTVPGATEAYHGKTDDNSFKDEIWITGITESDESMSRLRQFLRSLKKSPKHKEINLEFHLEGPKTKSTDILRKSVETIIFEQDIVVTTKDYLESPILIFRFKQGSLNSRKADITPFLPK